MNPKRILIVSEAGDLHSDAVAWALRKKGHDCEGRFLGEPAPLGAIDRA